MSETEPLLCACACGRTVHRNPAAPGKPAIYARRDCWKRLYARRNGAKPRRHGPSRYDRIGREIEGVRESIYGCREGKPSTDAVRARLGLS